MDLACLWTLRKVLTAEDAEKFRGVRGGGTYQAWQRWARQKNDGIRPELTRLETFESGRSFTIGDITVAPFTIPHDAADPVGFTFRAEGMKVEAPSLLPSALLLLDRARQDQ